MRLGAKSNFWQMGDTGPCGPCSEIFYDHGEKYWGGPPGSPEEDGDRFVEIWNLVFMQFEQAPDGSRTRLPKPSVDTGMGLERVAAVMQGTNNNYEIDLFKTLISATMQATGFNGDPATPSLRVIADHLRSMSFLIAEGVLPSNEGRGYVLRRIMRRAMRHATLLGANDAVIHRIVPTLVREMGQAYPELVRGEAMIVETIHLEERRFLKTLSRGLQLLDEATSSLHAGDMLEGVTAFKLYDTYGFPLDLTQDALRSRNIHVDLSGFEDAMARQRAEARKSWAGSGEAATGAVWFGLADKFGPTEFLGYETETAEGEIKALLIDGAEVPSIATGQEGYVVVNQTPFYGESGGQVGDTGRIKGDGVLAEVVDTNKFHGVFAHKVKVSEGTLKVGQAVELVVDHARRGAIRANHSATHLLHEALRLVLGDHVAQKGSMVAADRLRFDFVHTKPMSPQEIAEVEDIANSIILQNTPVETRLMGVEEAKDSGARALFGEKYGDEVRVVSMGLPTGNGLGWSVELCGGTHVRRTGDIGLVSILGDSAVAAGVRRIEALTGKAARHRGNDNVAIVSSAAGLLRAGRMKCSTDRGAAGPTQEDRARVDRCPPEARHGWRHRRRRLVRDGQWRHLCRARGRWAAAQGPARPRRPDQEADRLGHRGHHRPGRGRQGGRGHRRHRGSGGPLFGRRSGQGRRCGSGRAGRRRPSRHGPGRWARWGQGRRGHRCHPRAALGASAL